MYNNYKHDFNSILLLKSRLIAVYVIFGVLLSFTTYAQTPGLIYKPAGSALGRSVLDPNGDGFVSATSIGFSGTDYGSSSELNMVALPIVGVEPTGDLTTGASGGHTDIVNDGSSSNQSCYLLYKQVGGVYYLIIRFRIGSASTSSKGYSFLLDTDGVFGSLLTSGNPGFDKEIVLETGNSGRIAVYDHSASGTTLRTSFTLDNYHQRSIALSIQSSNADYFYDFFIPYSALGLSAEPVRISAVTVTSAGSGITGSKSDYNGINDQLYGNDPIAIAKALITTFPSTSLTALTEGYTYASVKTTIPVVNGGINTASTSISGTSAEANGTTITVYKNGVSIGTTTVNNNSWTLTGVSGLVAGNLITAAATASGKTISDASASIEVTAVAPCYTRPPVITLRSATEATGNQVGLTGSWSGAVVPNGSNVIIKLYSQTSQSGSNTLVGSLNSNTYYVKADGTWQFITNLSSSQLQTTNFFATATIVSTGCESGLSEVSKKTNGQTGTVTATPTIVTTTILASPSVARSVEVRNNDATAAHLILYENGYEIARTQNTIASGATHIFSYTGFVEADSVFARAQSMTADYWLSNLSNRVVVTASAVQSNAPVISGTYTAGSGKTISGTSDEAAGTIITLYKNGVAFGTFATVTAFGTWQITGVTLATNDVLTAKAKATGETESVASNTVTVAASAPSAPAISGNYQSGVTTISGTAGDGTVTVYVDGSPVGTVSNASGNWTLSGISAELLYKGGVITATNTKTGITGAVSAGVTITGVSSFKITDITNNLIGTQVAGVAFNVKFTAMDGLSGTGSTVAGFSGKVIVSSTSTALTGTGQSNSFSSGVLTPHQLNLTSAGANKTITVVSVDDPTAVGTATIALIEPNTLYKLTLNAPDNFAPGNRAAYTVTRKDAYDNLITTGSTIVYLTVSSANGSFRDAATNGNTITSVNIGSGESAVNFWMLANAGGLYSITASDASPVNGNIGLIDASDEVLAGTIWTGNTSTDWATGSNWEGNTVPATGADIVIPEGRSNYPILDQNRTVGNMFMGVNATTRLNIYTLTVQGAFIGTGKYIGSTSAAITLTGTGVAGVLYFDQTNAGTSNKLAAFTMNRTTSGEVTLGADLIVNTLTLSNGKIDVGDYTFTTTANNGGSASAYVKTTGLGVLKTNITVGATIPFPVGNSNFNPVTIVNNTAAADDFSVQVIDEVYQNGNGRNGSATTLNAARIKRTWEISKSTGNANSGSGINLIFDWNSDEEVSTITNYSLYHYTGNRWREETDGAREKAAGQRRFTFSGYKGTFSPFTILEGNAMLPVRWKSVKAEKIEKVVSIVWETVEEQNSGKFFVQHSTDARVWKEIGSVGSAGNSAMLKKYDLIHYQPENGINYYRIMQRDLDGKIEYSAVAKMINNVDNRGLQLVSNPVVNGTIKLISGGQVQVVIYDLNGKPVVQKILQQGENNLLVSNLPKGMYVIKTPTETKKVMLQ
ncbi:MAG: T9SS type A sorting domain-containing protein [Chitinophagia bacterium]|jgi:hypothetical protein